MSRQFCSSLSRLFSYSRFIKFQYEFQDQVTNFSKNKPSNLFYQTVSVFWDTTSRSRQSVYDSASDFIFCLHRALGAATHERLRPSQVFSELASDSGHYTLSSLVYVVALPSLYFFKELPSYSLPFQSLGVSAILLCSVLCLLVCMFSSVQFSSVAQSCLTM